MQIILLSFLFFALNANAQAPATEWTRCLGGSSNEEAKSVKATSDGGAVIIGTTQSGDGDITDPPGYIDFWIVKLDAAGTIQWQKTLGSNNTDYAYSIEQTSDGGYVFTGTVGSTNGDVTPSAYGSQIWVVKLSSTGAIQWQKTFGGTYEEYGYCIRQTTDGGYIVAGSSSSTDGNVTGNHGDFDVWILKLSATGTLQWQKSYGGSLFDEAYSIRQTSDGGYVVAAYTDSNNGNVTGFHGFYDIWVLKLNALGNLVWQKTVGGTGQERPNDIIVTTDNNYMIAGYTNSTDGDSTGVHFGIDAWVVKLNPAGVIQWQRTYGGNSEEVVTGIVQTADGFALSGTTESNDSGDITGSHPSYDGWAFKINPSGAIQWQRYFGSESIDSFAGIQKSADGGLLLAGMTMSASIEGVPTHGGVTSGDYLVVKLSATLGTDGFANRKALIAYPNPVVHTLCFNNGNVNAVDVYDNSGRLLRSGAVTENRIDLQGLASGQYIVKAYEGDAVSIIKVVKQ
jgi:hypothetical protein